MKIGLIGYGSIGKRHVKNLLSLGYNEITLFREKGKGNEYNLKEDYDFASFTEEEFKFIIISNPTTFHYKTALPLIKLDRNLLIEKPLVFINSEYSGLKKTLEKYNGCGMVAYNMRFHPCLIKIKQLIDGRVLGNIYSSRFFVGQYLPDWRPDQDYRTGVSALKSLGGGVVLELIHEIDMALFLFGKPVSKVNSVALRSSDLDIETEDISEILYISESNTIISIHQDYLNRDYHRTIEMVGEKGTLFCDLKTSGIKVIGDKGDLLTDDTIPFERNDMYLSMMKYYLDCLENKKAPVPDLVTSLESVRVALKIKETNKL